ncbi:hypothetical protein Lgra_0203 [Legionella gratiana]|uniref:Uncharacterized protein n=2 Tax=Legionella gratiana TaxID=45066 RepID=A0A378JK93_9GAMM|nr:hypothetical protein Lgra_0203 [Legionella gratiana]STX45120.1 Uncharacterised protein [Legionella gratiana]
MQEREHNSSTKNTDENKNSGFLANIVKKIFELLLSIFGLKMGDGPPPTNKEVADHINNQKNLGDHLEKNASKLSTINTLLGIPGASSLAEKQAKSALKPYLDSPEVRDALNDQLNGPQGDKIRNELAKYPNICKLINNVAQNTKSEDLAQKATQNFVAQDKNQVANVMSSPPDSAISPQDTGSQNIQKIKMEKPPDKDDTKISEEQQEQQQSIRGISGVH